MTTRKTGQKTMLIAALFLICAALTSCAASITSKTKETSEPSATGDSVEHQPTGNIRALGGEAVDRLEVGEEALIDLSENHTTGFIWHYEIAGDGIVEVISDEYISDPNPNGVDGVGGSRRITIKAVAPGEASIEMVCKRADDEIAETRAYPIVVSAADDQAVSGLSPREAEVFRRLLDGAKMKDIAAELGVNSKAQLTQKGCISAFTKNSASPVRGRSSAITRLGM